MTVLLGTLLSSIKQIEAPYVFHWENTIALHAMQGNRASSRGEGEVSLFSSSCSMNLGYILELRRGCPFETGVCSVKSGHLSRYDGHRGKLNEAGGRIQMLLNVSREAKCPLFVGTVILVFLSILTKSQAWSPFEALNPAQLSMCQRDVRPTVQKRWSTMASSRVSTGDSVIPSS